MWTHIAAGIGGIFLGYMIWGSKSDAILDDLQDKLNQAEARYRELQEIKTQRVAAGGGLTTQEQAEELQLTASINSLVGQIRLRKEALAKRQ